MPVPEKIVFKEPEPVKGFFGRKYIPPPEKLPHFSNLQFKENYKVKRAHLIVNPYSGKKKGEVVANFVKEELSNDNINCLLYTSPSPRDA